MPLRPLRSSRRRTGGSTVANGNTACVLQTTTIDGSTAVLKKGMPVTVTLDAHQSISIKQDSQFGGNTVKNATRGRSMRRATPLTQDQSITSKASGSGAITQKQNAAPGGPNMLLDIEQNQSIGYENAHGSEHLGVLPDQLPDGLADHAGRAGHPDAELRQRRPCRQP